MSKAEDLLNSLSDEEIMLYSTAVGEEGHIIISSDRTVTVPDELKKIGIQYDHNVKTVTFDCPRYSDGVDMSGMAIYVNYMRPDGYKDAYPCTNITIDETDPEVMHFDWTITRNVTQMAGNLRFLICVKKTDLEGNDVNHWNSDLCSDVRVGEGLECEEQIEEENADAITAILTRLDTIEQNPVSQSVKSIRPTNGVEHFTVKINKANLSVNAGTTGIQDSVTEYTDSGVIFLPETYTQDGAQTRLVISCHGSGTVIDDSFGIATKTWNNFLYQMGYAIMDVNGGSDDSRHFGAPFAIQSYIKAYQYVIDKYNLYPEVFVLGGSMGGLPAFTLAQCGVIPVKALAGFCPVVDLLRQAWMNPWYSGSNGEAWGTQRKLIAEYYNFSDYDTFDGWTNTKVPSEAEMQYFIDNSDKWQGYNPMTCGAVNGDSILTTATSGYADLYDSLIKVHKVPTKIWQSDVDPTVSSEFGKYIVSAIKKSGGIAYHRSYPSGGHTPGWGESVAVINEKGEPVSGYSNEAECYYWFKRWE